MFQTIELNSAPEVLRLIRAAVPAYRQRKAYLYATLTAELRGTYWSGGTHYTYTAVDMATLKVVDAPQYNPACYGGPATTPKVEIPVGIAIVRHGSFCGKKATAEVMVNPANLSKLIAQEKPAPTPKYWTPARLAADAIKATPQPTPARPRISFIARSPS